MPVGFIKLHRKILEWEWYDDMPVCRLFIHILLKANYQENSWKGESLKPGSFITGRKVLSSELGMSEQQIRTALKKLEKSQEITIKATKNYSIISINKWNEYQFEYTANNQKTTTAKEDNKQINNKSPTGISPKVQSEFDELWNLYEPIEMTKGNKKKAQSAYATKIEKGASHEEIIRGLKQYIEYCQATNCRTKHVSTWINQEGWKDEYQFNNKPTRKQNNSNERTSYFDQLHTAALKARASYNYDL